RGAVEEAEVLERRQRRRVGERDGEPGPVAREREHEVPLGERHGEKRGQLVRGERRGRGREGEAGRLGQRPAEGRGAGRTDLGERLAQRAALAPAGGGPRHDVGGDAERGGRFAVELHAVTASPRAPATRGRSTGAGRAGGAAMRGAWAR